MATSTYSRLPVEGYEPSYWLLGDDELDLAEDLKTHLQ
jgi:hypothetical protein